MPEIADAAVAAELSLWRGVIAQALEDAGGSPGALNGWDWRRGGADRLVAAARRWFREDGDDFRLVCELAGLEPGPVRRLALSQIEAGERSEADGRPAAPSEAAARSAACPAN